MRATLLALTLSLAQIAMGQDLRTANATSLQGKRIQSPLSCNDGYVITWVAANSRFECLAGGGGGGSASFSGVTPGTNTGALVVGTGGTLTTTGSGAITATALKAAATGADLTLTGNLAAATVNKLTLTTPATAATLSLANNSSLITSGAFSATLTATASTNSTLPAGTHSLPSLDSALYTSQVISTKASPYPPAASGTVNCCTGAGTSSQAIIFTTGSSRFRQAGTVTSIKLYWGTASGGSLSAFYFQVWRRNSAGRYDIVGQSENLVGSLTTGSVNTITLAQPITGVQEGDYYGIREQGSLPSDTLTATFSSTYGKYYFLINSAASYQNVDWEGTGTQGNGIVWIESYMDSAPVGAAIGDSIISGLPLNYSFADQTTTSTATNIPATISGALGTQLGYPVVNLGINAQTTTQIAARIADVTNAHPKFAVLQGGINDVDSGGSEATFLANWTTMLNAVTAAGIVPVVLQMFPCSHSLCTNTVMGNRDTWRTDLASLVAGYPTAILIDMDSDLGQFRTGGAGGNKWDIKPQYNADTIHLSAAGYQLVAQRIAAALEPCTVRAGIYVTNQTGVTDHQRVCTKNQFGALWQTTY